MSFDFNHPRCLALHSYPDNEDGRKKAKAKMFEISANAEITEDDDDLSWALSDEFVAKGEMVMLEKGEAELGAIA